MKKNLFDDAFNLDPAPAPVHFQDQAITKVKYDFEKALSEAKERFKAYQKKIEDMAAKVKAFKVNSDADAAELTKLAAEAAELAKTLEENRKEKIKDPDTYVRKLNAFVKSFRDILTEPKAKTGLVEIAKKKIGDYQFQKELQRRKAEKQAQDEAAKLQAKMDKEAAEAGVEAPQLPAMQMPQTTGPIRTESGSANFGTEWIYELEDITKVPADYLIVNDQKAKAAIKAGIREIPGLKIKEVPKVGIRTR